LDILPVFLKEGIFPEADDVVPIIKICNDKHCTPLAVPLIVWAIESDFKFSNIVLENCIVALTEARDYDSINRIYTAVNVCSVRVLLRILSDVHRRAKSASGEFLRRANCSLS
jgi:hypothetical protein